MMAYIVSNFSILLVSESKLDSSFPNSHFKRNANKIFRRDRNKYGGGVPLYVNKEMPGKISNQTKIKNKYKNFV